MKKILFIIILSVLILPLASKAQDTYTLLEPLPCITGVGNCSAGGMQTDIDLNTYILYIYKFAIGLAVFLAIVMIIWGGFLYITSETPFKIEDGKAKITGAVQGLVMVLISYIILATIDPRLVNIESKIPDIKIPAKIEDVYRDPQFDAINNYIDINRENRDKLKDIDAQLIDLQQQKLDLDKKVARGEIMTTQDELEAQQGSIDAKIAALKSSKNVLVAENAGVTSMRNVLAILNTPEIQIDADSLKKYINTDAPNGPGGGTPRNVSSPNVIQNAYNQQINELLKTNANADKIQILEKQRDFYITQAQEEVRLKAFIDTGVRDSTSPSILSKALGATFVAGNIGYKSLSGLSTAETGKVLTDKILEYGNASIDKNKQLASGLSATTYRQVYQTRIDTLKQEIAKLPSLKK